MSGFAGFPKALKYFAIPSLTLSVYMIWNLIYIGTAMPVSGQIKRWWGTMLTVYGKPATQVLDILGLTSNPDLSSWSLLALPPFSPFDWLAEYSTITENAYWRGVFLLSLIYIGVIVFLLIKGWPYARKAIDELALPPIFVGMFFTNGKL